MEIYFLSVGYGEAMVALDGEHCLLIDGGSGVDDAAYTQPGTIPAVTFLKEKQVEFKGKAGRMHRLHDLHARS